jgi:hypothetical protein
MRATFAVVRSRVRWWWFFHVTLYDLISDAREAAYEQKMYARDAERRRRRQERRRGTAT